MIKEEFKYNDIKDYLLGEIDILIIGTPKIEERSKFFYQNWEQSNKIIIIIDFLNSNNNIKLNILDKNILHSEISGDLTRLLPNILRRLYIQDKNILMDTTSLNPIVIMFLTRILIKQVKPKTFFASYIRPKSYCGTKDNFKYTLTSKISGIKAVPGFVKREIPKQTLCAFLGFEGVRFNAISESLNDVAKTIPISAFPSGSPHWFNITMWNSMNLLIDNKTDQTAYKCSSESIFEAVSLLKEILTSESHVVLAPIGTRPHTVACAIYASLNNNARIIYDYAIESDERTEGIAEINIYHLSSFIDTN